MMNSYSRMILLGTLAVLAAAATTTTRANDAPITVQFGEEHWVAGSGFLKGIDIATFLGNLNQAGSFAVRVRLPAATRWPVHHHKYRLNATIISGVLLVGFGNHFDATKMVRLTAGSFVSVPAGMNYYDSTVGVTVVQEEGMGPLTTVIPKPT
jgi:quercetin dioxygenase-like cupin family protein